MNILEAQLYKATITDSASVTVAEIEVWGDRDLYLRIISLIQQTQEERKKLCQKKGDI